MYYNAYDSNGGDVVDAGIGTNISAATAGNAASVSFINTGGGNYLNYGWTNQSQQYNCGTPIGIMYGTLAPPNQNMSALATGIPDYDPSQLDLPPTTTTWLAAAWNFFSTNNALLQGPTSWYGYQSNCAACSIGQMVTIAQPGLSYDGSCYGYCSSAGADAFWYESVAGQLIAPCNQNSGLICTIEYIPSWVGGQNNSGAGIAYAPVNDQYVAEGLNLTGTFGNSSKSRRTLSSSLPPAPTSVCSLDSHGYCSKIVSSGITGSCTRPPVLNNTVTTYYIFNKSKPSELLVSAVNTITHDNQHGCTPLSAWSPWDPALHYNDPSLP